MPTKTLGRSSSSESKRRQAPTKRAIKPIRGERPFTLDARLITPETISLAYQSAAGGNLGPLQGIYKRMRTDARISGLIRSLTAAIASAPTQVKESRRKGRAASKALVIARELELVTSKRQMSKKLVLPYLGGLSAFSLGYEVTRSEGGSLLQLPSILREVSPARLGLDRDVDSATYGEVTVVTEDEPKGKAASSFPRGSVLVVQEEESMGFQDLSGALRPCVPWWFAKNANSGYWSEFNELYAHPTVMAYYDENADAESIDELYDFLRDLQRHAMAAFPKGAEVDYVQTAKAGQVLTYKDFISLCNDELTISLVGQLQTSDGGSAGSYAKARIQDRVRFEIIREIAKLQESAYRDLLVFACEQNLGTAEVDPYDLPEILVSVPNPEDNKNKIVVFKGYQEIGGDLDPRYVQGELGIPALPDGVEPMEPRHLKKIAEAAGAGAQPRTKDDTKKDTKDDGQ